VASLINRLPKPEIARWLVLLATGLWLFHPFMTGRQIGAGDALWYAHMLADYVIQLRAGIFPVFVGQTDYAFNGAVYPLRVAPLFQHLAGSIDLVTFRQLGFFALQHATVIVCGFAGLFASYLTLVGIAPSQRWAACGLAVLYVSCPGVLGTIYTQDLYMTWMTVPILPVAVYGIVRTFQNDDLTAQACLAAGLAALWLAHSPIALWMTLIAGGTQAVRLLVLHRHRAAWLRALAGVALFVVLGLYPFVSLASLRVPGATSTVTASLAHPEQIAAAVRAVFPAILLPLSDHARTLADLQLGYGLWLVLLAVIGASILSARWELPLLLVACLGLLVLLLPVPFLNDWLWLHLPETLRRITYYWPMQRFYLLLAVMLAAGGQIALDLLGGRYPRLRSVLGSALLLGCGWSLWETRQFIRAGEDRTASAEVSARDLRPENRLLMTHAYGFLPALPAYFSHGVMDPRAETRLLTRDQLEVMPSTAGTVVLTGDFQGQVDDNPGVLKLTPALPLEPGQRYALDFEFGPHRYAGVLQLSGRTFFREYLLPQSGEPRAFGTDAANDKSLSLWTTTAEPEIVTLRFIPTDGSKPVDFSDFARFTFRKIDPTAGPVTVTSLLPFRAEVHSATDAWLETPRVFISGYGATVDGQPAELQRSPQGLVMIPVTPTSHEIELRYSAPIGLRVSYWLSLFSWMTLVIIVLPQKCLPKRNHG